MQFNPRACVMTLLAGSTMWNTEAETSEQSRHVLKVVGPPLGVTSRSLATAEACRRHAAFLISSPAGYAHREEAGDGKVTTDPSERSVRTLSRASKPRTSAGLQSHWLMYAQLRRRTAQHGDQYCKVAGCVLAKAAAAMLQPPLARKDRIRLQMVLVADPAQPGLQPRPRVWHRGGLCPRSPRGCTAPRFAALRRHVHAQRSS